MLEGKGEPLAFFVTEGFEDLLGIRNQRCSDLFSLDIRKSELLYGQSIGVPERIDASGETIKPLDLEAIHHELVRLAKSGCRAAAISLIHSYRNLIHERQLGQALRNRGIRWVSMSADLSPSIKWVPRAETAFVDACLAPIINEYFNRAEAALGSGTLRVLTSAGGLVALATYRPKDCLLSGPAGREGRVGDRRASAERHL